MPFKESTSGEVPTDTDYIIFYASIDPVTDKLWCGDCRDVEQLVRETFEADDVGSARIVYVGPKPEWKSASHPLRHGPWFLTAIPTIMKLQNGKEVKRLVEGEVAGGLAAFVRE